MFALLILIIFIICLLFKQLYEAHRMNYRIQIPQLVADNIEVIETEPDEEVKQLLKLQNL